MTSEFRKATTSLLGNPGYRGIAAPSQKLRGCMPAEAETRVIFTNLNLRQTPVNLYSIHQTRTKIRRSVQLTSLRFLCQTRLFLRFLPNTCIRS
jgi:hypothetical protein